MTRELRLVGADERVFQRVNRNLIRRLRDDLRWAGIEPSTLQGKVDLHALRHTFGTLLAQSGRVSQRVAQALLRHVDPRTTARIYQRISGEMEVAAMAELPAIGSLGTRNREGKIEGGRA
jgi:integrase